MTQGHPRWNEWDVPYFGPPTQAAAPTHATTFVGFADGGVRTAERVLAVLIGVGAILAGILVTWAILFLSFVLSWLSTPGTGDRTFAISSGAAVAGIGILLAIATFVHAGRKTGITVEGDALEI